MLARRFLGCLVVLILLAVGGAFLFFQFGQQVIVRQAIPKGHFQPPPSGDSGPDYAKAESWIARPGREGDPTLWLPDGEVLTLAPTRVAAFYIHPTTYLSRDKWNAAIDEPGETASRTILFARSQASVFNQVADIWAPRYRQAAYGAFLLTSDDATKALDLAYRDVRRAFDAFLAEAPADKPIILAAHSQGSLHLLRLLKERREALNGRLVAAYVGGWPVGTASDLPATGLTACSRSDQPGCVVTWQSFGDPANTSLITDAWLPSPSLTGKRHQLADIACTNPVSGSAAASAPAANPGTLVPSADFAKAGLQPGRVGARCEKGFLVVSGAIPAMGPFVLPGNNYHVYDYALFWKALREDAARRLAAFEAAR
jgi:hypothetical protein